MSPTKTIDELIAAGYRPEMAGEKVRLLEEARSALPACDLSFIVPGRIEVLGKHTDYCGGQSLLCATEQGFCGASRALDEPVLRIHAISLDKQVEIPLGRDSQDGSGWTGYPRAVVRRMRRNFGNDLRGVELALTSDLPAAAGMSSSTALIIACFIALAERNELTDHPLHRAYLQTPEALAHYLGCMENGSAFGPLQGEPGVGTSGGSQDHVAILASRPGYLSRFSFAPVTHIDDYALPDELIFVIAVSGVVAEKTGAAREAYNAVSDRARQILAHWNDACQSKHATLQEVVSQTPRSILEATAPELRPRLEQFIRESVELVPQACAALRAADLQRFGLLVDESQLAAEKNLRNQVPETVYLASTARQHGALAASAFGAGFGGSVWALVDKAEAGAFIKRWGVGYAMAFPDRSASFITTTAGPPAHVVQRDAAEVRSQLPRTR